MDNAKLIADNKKRIKKQLKILLEKCPDLAMELGFFNETICPFELGINYEDEQCPRYNGESVCFRCWQNAIK